MGFRYNAHPENIGFEYDDPLPTDEFATLLLHSQTLENKPFLSKYISSQIMEYVNPPWVIPQICKKLILKNMNTIDPTSPIIKCGYLIMNPDGTIVRSCLAVKDAYIIVKSNGKIDEKCKPYKHALKRYIRQLIKETLRIKKIIHQYNHQIEEPYLICYEDGTVDPSSKFVVDGEVLLTKDFRIDKRGSHYKNHDIRLTQNGEIDKRCKWFKEGKIIILII